jgi:hypothetical protein
VTAAALTIAAPPANGAAAARPAAPARSGGFAEHLQRASEAEGTEESEHVTPPQDKAAPAKAPFVFNAAQGLPLWMRGVMHEPRKDAVNTETRDSGKKNSGNKAQKQADLKAGAAAIAWPAATAELPAQPVPAILPLALSLGSGHGDSSEPAHRTVAWHPPAGDVQRLEQWKGEGPAAPVPAEEKNDGAAHGAPQPQELVFAAKVKENSPERKAATPEHATTKRESEDSTPCVHAVEATAPVQARTAVVATFERPADPAPTEKTPASAAPAAPEELHAVQDESQMRPAPALKDISLQVTQPSHGKVQVRVNEQGGELHVAVKTADADLTHDLRQGLSDLVDRLQQNGFRTETWHPVHGTSAPAAAAESSNAGNEPQGGDPQQRQGQPQQGGEQQNQNSLNRPRWVEELESSLTGEPQPAGENYGFGN